MLHSSNWMSAVEVVLGGVVRELAEGVVAVVPDVVDDASCASDTPTNAPATKARLSIERAIEVR
jgi:hypothetical protein